MLFFTNFFYDLAFEVLKIHLMLMWIRIPDPNWIKMDPNPNLEQLNIQYYFKFLFV